MRKKLKEWVDLRNHDRLDNSWMSTKDVVRALSSRLRAIGKKGSRGMKGVCRGSTTKEEGKKKTRRRNKQSNSKGHPTHPSSSSFSLNSKHLTSTLRFRSWSRMPLSGARWIGGPPPPPSEKSPARLLPVPKEPGDPPPPGPGRGLRCERFLTT